MLAVRYGHPTLRMPPTGKLTADEIRSLEQWITTGAEDPRTDLVPGATQRAIDIEAGRRFWSFQPLGHGDVPTPLGADPAATDIDRFVLAGLLKNGRRPPEDVDPYALIRRLTFDLIGLPPTPEEIASFVADDSPQAYDKLVSRLLASPHFGERWGRHWLDVVRFAESSGGGRSLMFKDAWRFRDYVIDSYNDDVPLDRFVKEQIAGDLLPHDSNEQRHRQLIASGFLALGPTNYEQQDKALLAMDVIDEQIDTIGRAFMGLTLGCARCHDHKFDPIPTTDYYALAGILGSTRTLTPGNVSGYVEHELPGSATDRWHRHDQRRKAITKELKALRSRLKGRAGPRQIARDKLKGIVLDDLDATLIGDWKLSTAVAGYLANGYLHDQDVLKGMKSVTFAPDIPVAGVYEVRLSYTSGSNRATNVPITIDAIDGARTITVNQRHPPPIDGAFISLGRARFARGLGAVISISNSKTDGHVIADSVQLIHEDDLTVAAKPSGSAKIRAQVADLQRRLKRLDKRAPPPPPKAMGVKDARRPADGHVHIRGGVRNFGPTVQRGFVSVCSTDKPRIPNGQSGRLQLAEWLTAADHPLTARVYVNRVWQHLFGVGIVPTPDNFGATGTPPTDPAFLDWLARRFIDGQWSSKGLIRDIVRSRAYRAQGKWRRLDAESIRDAMLAVSGRLDPTMGGLTIRKLTQYDYGYKFDTRRRSVYVPWLRNSMLEMFEIFDVANPNLVTGKRNVSNVAPQSLYLLNSPWVLEQARHAATRVLAAIPDDLDAQIVRAYMMTLGREPDPEELRVGRTRLRDTRFSLIESLSDVFHALFASVEFRYLN